MKEMRRITPKSLWDAYSKTPDWKDVNKTHENLFRLGAEAVILRADMLLVEFINHKSDANKWLIADDDEELIRDFMEYWKNFKEREDESK